MSENEERVKFKLKITIIDENNAEERSFAGNEKEGG